MKFKSFFLFTIYENLKNKLPAYVLGSMAKLIPAFFISSLFEIFGLVILLPVINIIIDPSIIDKSFYLKFIYSGIKFKDTTSFVLFLMSAVTLVFIAKNILLYFIYKLQSNTAFYLCEKIAFGKYASYLNKPYKFHSENNSANLLRNFIQLPTELINYSVLPFFNILNEIFILFLITIGIAIYDPLLFASLLLFTSPFIFAYDRIYKKKLKQISELRNSSHGAMYKAGMQSMEGFREIVVFNKKEYFKTVFENHLMIFSKTSGESYLMNIF
jgi:ABC-type multidrug transport system fused ATPase/permease subunit